MYKNNVTTLMSSLLLMVIGATAAGCAAVGRDLIANNVIRLQSIDSQYGGIARVVALQRDHTMLVSGDVMRRSALWGPIPGRLDVEVIGPKGDVLQEKLVAYQDLGYKSLYSIFEFTLKLPPKGSILLLRHEFNERR